MNRLVLPLIVGSLLLPLGCGGNDATDPFATLAVSTTSLPDGVANEAYSHTLAATGGDSGYSWALTASSGPLPSGLSLATNGDITGTPTMVETSNFTVEVASGDGQSSQQALSITVSGRFLAAEFAVEVERDIVYATGAVRSPTPGEIDLLLDVYRPADANLPPLRPGLVLIHGGGFTGGSKTNTTMVSLGNAFAQRGYVSVSIDYRLVGDDPPTEDLARDPTDPVSVAAAAARVDATRAVEWMRANAAAYGIDPNRIAIGGYSAGAITSMGVAFQDPGVDGADVQVVLSLSGGLYGQESIIDADDPPLIMIHGRADATVPFSLAEAISAQALAVGLTHEFYPLDGVGHGTPAQLETVVDDVTLADRIRNFFFDHLELGAL
jgi:acetyl esterase/lipase